MMTRKRKVGAIAAAVMLCLGVVVTRACLDGRRALARGDAAMTTGDREGAIMHWRRAARWYVPLAPHVVEAYARLERTASEAEQNGDITTALAAWRAIRTSVNATRHLWVPHSEYRGRANRRIAALMAAQEGPAADPKATAEQREQWHYTLLSRHTAPSVGWTLVAMLGLALLLAGAVLFCVRGVTRDDRLDPAMAIASAICIGVGLLVWATGLYFA